MFLFFCLEFLTYSSYTAHQLSKAHSIFARASKPCMLPSTLQKDFHCRWLFAEVFAKEQGLLFRFAFEKHVTRRSDIAFLLRCFGSLLVERWLESLYCLRKCLLQ